MRYRVQVGLDWEKQVGGERQGAPNSRWYDRGKSLKKKSRDFPGGPVVETLPSNEGGLGSIPGQGAKIPQASGPKNQNVKQKQCCDKFNKDFKNGPHQKIFKKKRKKKSSLDTALVKSFQGLPTALRTNSRLPTLDYHTQ